MRWGHGTLWSICSTLGLFIATYGQYIGVGLIRVSVRVTGRGRGRGRVGVEFRLGLGFGTFIAKNGRWIHVLFTML